MSTATVTGRRPRALRAPAPAALPRPSVRPVPTTHPPARAPFVVVVVVILSLGLGALLLLNTLLAQGSFTLHSLDDRVDALADREQALQQRASELAAPQRLVRRAHALGMVPSQNPAFLTADGGKVLGEPVPAHAPVPPAPVVGSGDPQQTDAGTDEKQQDDARQGRQNDGDGGTDR